MIHSYRHNLAHKTICSGYDALFNRCVRTLMKAAPDVSGPASSLSAAPSVNGVYNSIWRSRFTLTGDEYGS